jgi:hypothetical protein
LDAAERTRLRKKVSPHWLRHAHAGRVRGVLEKPGVAPAVVVSLSDLG